MRRALSLTAAPLLLAWRASPARAAGPGPDEVAALLSTLGPMPAGRTVEALSRHRAFSSPEAALRLVGALRHARGPAAALGLRALAHRDEPEVRAAALRAVAAGGLRLARGRDEILDALRSRSADVRAAGLEALGRVGDAQDLPFLLGALEAEDVETVQAANRAPSAPAGARVPYDPTR